jgi:hypothetical protein
VPEHALEFAPVLLPYRPAGQSKHKAAPWLLYFPGPQMANVELGDAVGQAKPAVQLLQAVAPAAQYFPAAKIKQRQCRAAELRRLKIPLGKSRNTYQGRRSVVVRPWLLLVCTRSLRCSLSTG